jgi:photosystem II stability/assembly factor-like uncharacterized protein
MDFVMKKNNILNSLTTFLFYVSIFLFFLAFNFQDSRTSGWYQQYMPNINGKSISDIFFIDSLNGWAVTPYSHQNDTAFIIKTTNGGDNWFIACRGIGQFVGSNKVKFINLNTGFIAGSVSSTFSSLSKTTNGGVNWFNIGITSMTSKDIAVINEDTLWFVNSDGLVGGAFLTTDGGLNWQVKYSQSGGNPSNIYMFNARIGFIGNLLKTTDGGNNWFTIIGEGNFTDMYFIDSLTGWKLSGGNMKKSTNGGINWINQTLPSGGNILGNGATKFSNINKDTIWAFGETIITNGIPWTRGILCRTTNGGSNWVYQLPDTVIHINVYNYGKFINKKIGWAYNSYATGVHTNVGGDTSFIMSTNNITRVLPKNFELKQNFPNPFNGSTWIDYYLNEQGRVSLKVYDISGKEMGTLVNEVQSIGGYGVPVTVELSSGVYFYKLVYINRKGEMQMETKKMILIK